MLPPLSWIHLGSVGIYGTYVILIQGCEMIHLITDELIELPYTRENFPLQPSASQYYMLNQPWPCNIDSTL